MSGRFPQKQTQCWNLSRTKICLRFWMHTKQVVVNQLCRQIIDNKTRSIVFYLWEWLLQWKLMCQRWVGSIHFAYERERPQNYYTAACRSHRYGYLGSPPPQQNFLQRLQKEENTKQEPRILTGSCVIYVKLTRLLQYYGAKLWLRCCRYGLVSDLVNNGLPIPSALYVAIFELVLLEINSSSGFSKPTRRPSCC